MLPSWSAPDNGLRFGLRFGFSGWPPPQCPQWWAWSLPCCMFGNGVVFKFVQLLLNLGVPTKMPGVICPNHCRVDRLVAANVPLDLTSIIIFSE